MKLRVRIFSKRQSVIANFGINLMIVAFQGIHGAYSDVAARQFFGHSCRTAPQKTFPQVFAAVENRNADRGMVPIENSLAGSIHENYDLLISHRVHIVGELHLRIEHVLACHPASKFEDLREIRSHPQALAQCSRFFAAHKKMTPVAYFDTAGAAQSLVRDASPAIGAISSAYAAQLYGLRILRHHLENQPNNLTRFLVIARRPWREKRGVPAKCSISFRPKRNQVGILFRVLGVFALRDIDLLKIESRPDPASAFEYLFYLDLAGGLREERVARALEHLKEMAKDFRLLGVYPIGEGEFYGARKRQHRPGHE